jgi:acyl-CoA reductase-like NAD-dependent aldehyde dehydrogenase
MQRHRQDSCVVIPSYSRILTRSGVDAVFGEILTTLSKIDYLVSNAESILAPSSRSTPLLLLHKRSKVVYEPLGLIAALVSWNYSMHNALSPILAGLMAGNAVVVKCSEQVAWSSKWFVGAVRECLTACGLDPEVVQVRSLEL